MELTMDINIIRFARNRIASARLYKKLINNDFLFNAHYYETQTGIRGLKASINHYHTIGWRRRMDPSPYFSTSAYLAQHPDVAAAGFNPLYHYVLHGMPEGRVIKPSQRLTTCHPSAIFNPPSVAKTSLASLTPPDDFDAHAVEVNDLSDLRRQIIDLGLYSKEYYYSFYPDIAAGRSDGLDHYFSHGWKENRNPSPRFDTAYYLRQNRDVIGAGICPLVHYVQRGRFENRNPLPDDRIVLPLARESPAARHLADGKIKLAVHAHIFFPELIGEILIALTHLPASAHVRFTVIRRGDLRYVDNYVRNRDPTWTFDVKLCERQGRDLGPLFTECGDLWRDNDYVLHVHTKRSLHTSFGDAWRQYLLDQCLGSQKLIASIVECFETEPRLACLYPENFYEIKPFIGMNGNESALKSIAHGLGLKLDLTAAEDFGAGSMVWMRASAYTRLVYYMGGFRDSGGPEQTEGTIAHALERALVMIPVAQGHTARSYSTKIRQAQDYTAVTRPLPTYVDIQTNRWARDTPWIALNKQTQLAPLVKLFTEKCLNIHWIVPSFGPGAGGHMTTFRIVEFLERFGHRQTIWIQNANNYKAPKDAAEVVRKHYRPIGENVFFRFLTDDVRQLSGDVVIATDCWTAYPAAAAWNFKERFYFIQDYEADFYPAGSNHFIAKNTYDMGFAALCAGPWLLEKAQQHGMWARQWDLAADTETYFPKAFDTGALSFKQTLDIAFYARGNTPRRAVELGFAAFAELADRGYKFRVHAFGADEILRSEGGYVLVDHGITSPENLAELYRQSDIGVVFSATNYSLIPLEMIACGLPVVELDSQSIRAVFTEEELLMVKPDPLAIADGIARLIESNDDRLFYRNNGLKFVEKFNWERTARQIERAVTDRLLARGYQTIDPGQICAPHIHKCRKASVFIPVNTGGAFFGKVLDCVLAQKTDFEFDVFCTDSGSKDNTVDLLKRKSKANTKLRYVEINPDSFQHGRTRNFGISMTDGEYIALSTADALPADDQWLAHLIAGFQNGPNIAGVTGRHRPYPEHGKFLARDFNQSFDHFRDLGNVYSYDEPISSHIYPGGIEWQMINMFYSDNNSAMSRAVWAQIPYPEIEWGEDMVWAWEVLKLGFQKAYQDKAVVYHSHAWERKAHRVWYATEGRFWKEMFGLDIADTNVEQVIQQWNERDRLYAIEERVPASQLAYQLKLNEARARGRLDGQNAAGRR